MQENESLESRSDARNNDVGRHRVRGKAKATGRGAYVVSLAVALAGFGLASVSAVVAGNDSQHPTTAAAAAVDEQSRAATAQRADRAQRAAVPTEDPAAPSSAPATPAAGASPAATPSAKPIRKPAWVSPMPGASTTSCYGQRWGVLHAGVDLGEPENTPIHAAGAGTVVAAGWAYSGYGISVVIDHGNGYLTHYAHQNKTVVRVGQKVSAGDLIGYEGSTGDSTGPHLHFEVHKGLWNQIDPTPWMRARGVDLGC